MRSLFVIFFLLIASTVEARMYQWVNPNTGSSQLSGKPPAWYRSETGGPRVLVFERNKLVDDTAVTVSEEQRLELRSQAFKTDVEGKEKTLTGAQAVATLEKQIQAIIDSPAMEQYLKMPAPPVTSDDAETDQKKASSPPHKTVNESDVTAKKEADMETPDERVERLKALISAWDKSHTEEAKSLLDNPAETNPNQDTETQEK